MFISAKNAMHIFFDLFWHFFHIYLQIDVEADNFFELRRQECYTEISQYDVHCRSFQNI